MKKLSFGLLGIKLLLLIIGGYIILSNFHLVSIKTTGLYVRNFDEKSIDDALALFDLKEIKYSKNSDGNYNVYLYADNKIRQGKEVNALELTALKVAAKALDHNIKVKEHKPIHIVILGIGALVVILFPVRKKK